MPNQPAANTLDSNGLCDECGQRHYDAQHGRISCAGHVRYDRDTYVPGQDRQPLEQPRPCRRIRPADEPPGWRCIKHGGENQTTKRAKERRMTEDRIERLAQRWAVPVETTPTEAILGRVSAYAGHVKFYGEMVAALADDALTWGVTRETDDSMVVGNGPSAYVEKVTKAVREAEPNTWLRLYEPPRD